MAVPNIPELRFHGQPEAARQYLRSLRSFREHEGRPTTPAQIPFVDRMTALGRLLQGIQGNQEMSAIGTNMRAVVLPMFSGRPIDATLNDAQRQTQRTWNETMDRLIGAILTSGEMLVQVSADDMILGMATQLDPAGLYQPFTFAGHEENLTARRTLKAAGMKGYPLPQPLTFVPGSNPGYAHGTEWRALRSPARVLPMMLETGGQGPEMVHLGASSVIILTQGGMLAFNQRVIAANETYASTPGTIGSLRNIGPEPVALLAVFREALDTGLPGSGGANRLAARSIGAERLAEILSETGADSRQRQPRTLRLQELMAELAPTDAT